MQQEQHVQPIAVVCLAALSDASFLTNWETHLLPLQRAKHITIWSERHLSAGASRTQEINKHLKQADLIMLLLSADFFASDECFHFMEDAIELTKTKPVRLIPLLLRPSCWQDTPLVSFPPLPANREPITVWDKEDAALDEVMHEFRRMLGLPEETLHRISTSSQRNRTHMLARLRLSYQDLMDQSLHGVPWLKVGLVQQPNAVHNAASMLLRVAHRPERLLPPNKSITHVYDEAAHELLILGEPGAGKTTLLYQLGLHLIMQAERDDTSPLPILLPLSTWAVRRRPLQEWIVEQLSSPLYGVPHQVSQQWIQSEQIIPLLDGLDEMEASARAICIIAINSYHHEHLHPLVVCSRSAEYATAAVYERLTLQSAVIVQPLTDQQINDTLIQGGKPLAALRSELKKNSELHDLVRSPFLLSILLLTYQGTTVRNLPRIRSTLQKQIFTAYIERIQHKGDVERYPHAQTVTWLCWLARQMRIQNQAIFYLELLQPDWLSTRCRSFYRWSITLVFILVIVSFEGLVWTLLAVLFSWLLRRGVEVPLGGLLGALPIGLMAGLGFGLFFRQRTIQPSELLTWSWKDIWFRLLVGFIFGLSGGGGFLRWRWLTTRISGKRLTERLHLAPNEGIRLSAKNGITTGLLVGLVFGFTEGLLVGLLVSPPIKLVFGLFEGLFIGLFIGLLVGLVFGLGAFIQHYVLRFWLWRTHLFPWKVMPFLEDTTARALLRRVGGGYSFTHRLLMDYFADLESPLTTAQTKATTGADESLK